MPDPPRRYHRYCHGCRRVDRTTALIAGSHADGGEGLRSERWGCPACGGTAYDVCSPYREGDFDAVPVAISAARIVRRIRRSGVPEGSGE